MGMRQMTYVDVSNLSREVLVGTARRLWAYVRPHGRSLLVAMGGLLLLSLVNLVPPWTTKIAVEDFIPNKNLIALALACIGLVGVYMARGAVGYLNVYLLTKISQVLVYEIARDMFHHLVRLSMRFFERQRTGETVSMLTADVQAVQQAMQGQVLNAVSGLLTMGVYAIVMFTLEWRLTLIILSVVPVMVIASVISARILRERYRHVQETVANINTAIEENVSGVRVSRAFARETEDQRRFQGENRANLRANMSTTTVESVATPFIEGLSSASVAIILLYGGWQIIEGTLTLGTLIAFLAYLQIFHQPITELVRVNYVIQSALAAADRIFHFMDERADIVDAADASPLPAIEGRVEFDRVAFSYDDVTPVLKNISFVASPGQMVALVGHTGSGKTTLVNLVSRFYDPTSGAIRIDGHDLRGVRLTDLRSQIAYVLQETYVFGGTIGENLRYGRLNATDDELTAAARLASAHGFISRLPEGYGTRIGEGGVRLSRGQTQRLALARAILASPRILILDEATSDVDTESEWEIQQAMQAVMQGRTVFVIAHRLSTIRNASVILVLQDGAIVQRGSHAELIDVPGPYRDLHLAQFVETAKPA